MFILAVSYLTTSNLPWFMDLTFQISMPYCSLQHQTLLPSPITSTWALFSLLLHLFILSGVISLLFFTLLLHWSYFSSSILGTYRPGEFIFQCHIFVISFRVMPFHTIHGVLDLIDRVPDELWMEVHDVVQETGSRPSPRKTNPKKQNGCLRRPYK